MSVVAASLLMSGVRHVVGTLWQVRDEVARTFAAAFYRTLAASETIGAAMPHQLSNRLVLPMLD